MGTVPRWNTQPLKLQMEETRVRRTKGEGTSKGSRDRRGGQNRGCPTKWNTSTAYAIKAVGESKTVINTHYSMMQTTQIKCPQGQGHVLEAV